MCICACVCGGDGPVSDRVVCVCICACVWRGRAGLDGEGELLDGGAVDGVLVVVERHRAEQVQHRQHLHTTRTRAHAPTHAPTHTTCIRARTQFSAGSAPPELPYPHPYGPQQVQRWQGSTGLLTLYRPYPQGVVSCARPVALGTACRARDLPGAGQGYAGERPEAGRRCGGQDSALRRPGCPGWLHATAGRVRVCA